VKTPTDRKNIFNLDIRYFARSGVHCLLKLIYLVGARVAANVYQLCEGWAFEIRLPNSYTKAG